MAKPGARSASTPNVAGNAGSGNQSKSTHPNTRNIDTSKSGVPGYASVKPTVQPVPSIADARSRRQKPDNNRVPVDLGTVGSASNEQMVAEGQQPLDPAARVDTKH